MIDSGNLSLGGSLPYRFRPRLVNRAFECFEGGRFDLACEAFASLDTLEPLQPHEGLIEYLVSAAKIPDSKARSLYEAALRAFPDNLYIQVSFAYFLLRAGDHKVAMSICDRILNQRGVKPSAVRGALNVKAKILVAMDHTAAALALLGDYLKRIDADLQSGRLKEEEWRKSFVTTLATRAGLAQWDTALARVGIDVVNDALAAGRTPAQVLAAIAWPGADTSGIDDRYRRAADHSLRVQTTGTEFARYLRRTEREPEARKMSEELIGWPQDRGEKGPNESFYFERLPELVDWETIVRSPSRSRGAAVPTIDVVAKSMSDAKRDLLKILEQDPDNYRATHALAVLLEGEVDLSLLRECRRAVQTLS